MMRTILLAAGLCSAGVAVALDVPQGSERDNRIQHVNYHVGDVVVVNTAVGAGLRIVFAPNERIIDAVPSFPSGWKLTPSRHILYVMPQSIGRGGEAPPDMPKPGEWDTNLMVATNLRLYDFDVHLLASERTTVDDRLSYRVEFDYPADRDERVAARLAEEEKQEEVQEALEATREIRNRDYTMQAGEGSELITPGVAYDDGVFTYLQFPPNGEMPAAFVINPDGTESLVRSEVPDDQPDMLEIHRVAPEFVLRLGKAVVGIYNEGYSADGPRETSNTTIPGVRRADRGTGR